MENSSGVEAYFAALTVEQRAALDQLRAAIRAVAPDATEDIYYRMPAFRVGGQALVSYAAFRDHLSLFPLGSSAIDAHLEAAGPYRTGKGTLQFKLDAPLPDAFVRAIVETRLAQIRARSKRR